MREAARSRHSNSSCSLFWEGLEREENVHFPFTIYFIESPGTQNYATRENKSFSIYTNCASLLEVSTYVLLRVLFVFHQRSCKPPGGGAMETERGVFPLNVCMCARV